MADKYGLADAQRGSAFWDGSADLGRHANVSGADEAYYAHFTANGGADLVDLTAGEMIVRFVYTPYISPLP